MRLGRVQTEFFHGVELRLKLSNDFFRRFIENSLFGKYPRFDLRAVPDLVKAPVYCGKAGFCNHFKAALQTNVVCQVCILY